MRHKILNIIGTFCYEKLFIEFCLFPYFYASVPKLPSIVNIQIDKI
jgi:hypothetical protein